MTKEIISNKKTRRLEHRGQAIVEFAIALPVLLMMLVGIMEVGRMVLMYTLVVNASRDAVRYASAVGRGDDGYHKYNDCLGIKTAAQQSAYIVTLSSVTISYDTGPGGTSLGTCDRTTAGEDSDISDTSGSRVTVTVTATYSPLVKLLPISSRTFTASSSRTLLGVYEVGY